MTDRVAFTKFVRPFGEDELECKTDSTLALKAREMDYEVEKRPLWFTSGSKTSAKSKPVKVPGKFATVRVNGDERYIATVGTKYHPIQCGEAFSVADRLVEHGFEIHSTGETQNSRRIFMNLKAPEGFTVLGAEESHDLFVMLRSSHDGTLTLQGLITPIRIFCQNQMRLISNTAIDRWRFRHLEGSDVEFEVETMLKLVDGYGAEYAKVAERLAAVDLELESTMKVLEQAAPKRTEWHEAIVANLRTSLTIPDQHRANGWGLVNATTEYLEWLRDVKTGEARFMATVDGAGLRTTRALVRALTR